MTTRLSPDTPQLQSLAELACFFREGSELGICLAIASGAFDGLIQGMSAAVGCSQGRAVHLEGDVAQHTAKVVVTLLRVSAEDPAVSFDEIDLLAALMHDVDKVHTRVEDAEGNVRFPGHEASAAARVLELAPKLGLSRYQRDKLDFLIREHGKAHSLPTLAEEEKKRLCSSEHWRNLRLLQKADALSCYLNKDGSSHLPVHWQEWAE